MHSRVQGTPRGHVHVYGDGTEVGGSSPRRRGLVFALGWGVLSAALVTAPLGCGKKGKGSKDQRPRRVDDTTFVESDRGDPEVVGCADGQREGFADLERYPGIAGCVGDWDGKKGLRDPRSGAACGDDLPDAICAAPADVCAPGWAPCGADGSTRSLRDRLPFEGCRDAGPGRFNLAVSHLPIPQAHPCPRVLISTELPCMVSGIGAESACCGGDCTFGKCRGGLWRDQTRISRGTNQGCGSVSSDRNPGVACCRAGEDVVLVAPAPGAAAAEGGVAAADDTAVDGAGAAEDIGEGAKEGEPGEGHSGTDVPAEPAAGDTSGADPVDPKADPAPASAHGA